MAPSSSLRLPGEIDQTLNKFSYTQSGWKPNARSSFTRILCGTLLIPRDQSSWLSLGSIRTSVVPMAFVANSTTDLTAWGALFLNDRPWTRLWRWMVYSLVTTSWRAERVLPPYIDRRQLHRTDTTRPWPDLFGFIRRCLERFIQHMEWDKKAQKRRTISLIPEDRWVSLQMVVHLWLTVVLYSYAGNAAQHVFPKRERTMDCVTLHPLLSRSYLIWNGACACGRRRLSRSQPTSPTLPGGRQRRRDKGESERPHGLGT